MSIILILSTAQLSNTAENYLNIVQHLVEYYTDTTNLTAQLSVTLTFKITQLSITKKNTTQWSIIQT